MEDAHSPAEFLVVLAVLVPLPADVICEREPDHDLFTAEPADQAQVLFVGLEDAGLVIEAWLDGGS
jgi:hypothetical protein